MRSIPESRYLLAGLINAHAPLARLCAARGWVVGMPGSALCYRVGPEAPGGDPLCPDTLEAGRTSAAEPLGGQDLWCCHAREMYKTQNTEGQLQTAKNQLVFWLCVVAIFNNILMIF